MKNRPFYEEITESPDLHLYEDATNPIQKFEPAFGLVAGTTYSLRVTINQEGETQTLETSATASEVPNVSGVVQLVTEELGQYFVVVDHVDVNTYDPNTGTADYGNGALVIMNAGGMLTEVVILNVPYVNTVIHKIDSKYLPSITTDHYFPDNPIPKEIGTWGDKILYRWTGIAQAVYGTGGRELSYVFGISFSIDFCFPESTFLAIYADGDDNRENLMGIITPFYSSESDHFWVKFNKPNADDEMEIKWEYGSNTVPAGCIADLYVTLKLTMPSAEG